MNHLKLESCPNCGVEIRLYSHTSLTDKYECFARCSECKTEYLMPEVHFTTHGVWIYPSSIKKAERLWNERAVSMCKLKRRSPTMKDELTKSVLLSVRPKWCEKIANGEKTLEVRKNKPKIPTPLTCYIYCTVGCKLLTKSHLNGNIYIASNRKYQEALEWKGNQTLNGKVIGEFVCDEITTDFRGECADILCKKGCLTLDELKQYSRHDPLYGWHISALQIYDKPKALSEFGISRAPQSWQYVMSKDDAGGDQNE